MCLAVCHLKGLRERETKEKERKGRKEQREDEELYQPDYSKTQRTGSEIL